MQTSKQRTSDFVFIATTNCHATSLLRQRNKDTMTTTQKEEPATQAFYDDNKAKRKRS